MGNGILALRWQNVLAIWIMILALGFVAGGVGIGWRKYSNQQN